MTDRPVFVGVATLVLIFSAPAAAMPVSGVGPLAMIVQVTESLCPDTRWEICHRGCNDQTHRAVLSWPVSIYFHKLRLGQSLLLVNRPFVEPQLRLDRLLFRFGFGHRVGLWKRSQHASAWTNPGLFAEVGGVLSRDDGSGAFVGGGVGIASFSQSWLLSYVSIVYRHSWTSVESRHDLTLDVVVVLDLLGSS